MFPHYRQINPENFRRIRLHEGFFMRQDTSSRKTFIKEIKTIFIFFPVIVMLLVSCRSFSPAQLNLSGSLEKGKIQKSKFEDFIPDWQPFAREQGMGLFYTAAKTSDPKLEFWAIKADLTEPSLKVIVNGQTDRGEFKSTRVSSFVRDNNLLAGINAVPFDPVSAKEGIAISCAGIVISNSILLAPPVPQYDAIVFYKAENPSNRRSAILSQNEIGDYNTIENAAGGFRIVLEDGVLPERLLPKTTSGGKPQPSAAGSRHPRSSVGLSADGNILYFLVIDGRRSGSIGATESELGSILGKLGAAWGLNLDGGGSSALALRFPDGKVRTINNPVHGGIRGRERAVAACVGIQFGYL